MKCKGCGREPKQIDEYRIQAKIDGYKSADEFVRREEGTYNPATEMFYCTSCYMRAGMPLGRA